MEYMLFSHHLIKPKLWKIKQLVIQVKTSSKHLIDSWKRTKNSSLEIKIVICKNSLWEKIIRTCFEFYSSAAPVLIQPVSLLKGHIGEGGYFVIMF